MTEEACERTAVAAGLLVPAWPRNRKSEALTLDAKHLQIASQGGKFCQCATFATPLDLVRGRSNP